MLICKSLAREVNVHTPTVIPTTSLILLIERVIGTVIFAASDDVPAQPGHRVRQAVAVKAVMAEETNKILRCYITDYENYPHPAKCTQ